MFLGPPLPMKGSESTYTGDESNKKSGIIFIDFGKIWWFKPDTIMIENFIRGSSVLFYNKINGSPIYVFDLKIRHTFIG